MPASSSSSREPISRHHNSDSTMVDRANADEAEEPIYEETAELHHQRGHSGRRASDDTIVGDETDEEEAAKLRRLPWWKRPSPWWLLCALPFTAMAMTSLLAPRIEVYTILICRQMRPDIYYEESSTSPALLPPPGSTPTRSQLCASDPVIQAGVSKLAALMTTSMGILSCLSTGWWGAFSDRYGRCRVMGISVIGLLLTDLNFIFIVSLTDAFPRAYWFLLLGPIVEGSLGGYTSGVAAIHAYQADVVDEHSRSRFFSLGLGLMFVGMAVGPTLASFVIRSTGQLMLIFYIATGLHFLYAFLVWFILPESLSLSHRLRAREKYAQELRTGTSEGSGPSSIRTLKMIKRLFAFLAPLNIFIPETREINNNPLKRRRDWNLTFLGIAYFLMTSMIGISTYIFQYAALTFGWTSENLGYWLSLVSGTRAAVLTVVIPLAIKIFKPKPKVIEIPTETVPLLLSNQNPSKKKEIHSPAFDLGLARISLVVEVVGFTCVGLALTPFAFTVAGMLGSMGVGFSPANQAVALALYTKRGGLETGRLFGALSVLQSLGSQILGPSIYAFIYVNTVATYPRAIFFAAVSVVAASAVLLAFVRLPKESHFAHTTVITEEPDRSTGRGTRNVLAGADEAA